MVKNVSTKPFILNFPIPLPLSRLFQIMACLNLASFAQQGHTDFKGVISEGLWQLNF